MTIRCEIAEPRRLSQQRIRASRGSIMNNVPCDIPFAINCGVFLFPVRRDNSGVASTSRDCGYAWYRAYLSPENFLDPRTEGERMRGEAAHSEGLSI